MPGHKEPSPEAWENVTVGNVETRADLLPEEQTAGGSADPEAQAALILAESEERTVHTDPDDAQGGHRGEETADEP